MAPGMGKEWGAWEDKIWPTQLACPPGFSVCLFKNVPVQKLPIKILPWPYGNVNYSARAGASPPSKMKTGKF